MGQAQRVAVNGVALYWAPVADGVPQGPNVFINDLDAELRGMVNLTMMLNLEELLTSMKAERPCRDTATN